MSLDATLGKGIKQMRAGEVRNKDGSSALAPSEVASPVGSLCCDAIVRVPDIAELPHAVRQRVKALSQDQWTEADWQDLLNTQRLIEHNLAARHGLLEHSNVKGEI